MPGADTFFARWSRVKSGEHKRIDDLQTGSADEGAGSTSAVEPHGSRVPGTEIDPASYETLDFSSDFSVYVRDGVSDAVQVAALRRLWLTDPLFGASDGLDIYCGDYSCGLPQDAPRSAGEIARAPGTPTNTDRSAGPFETVDPVHAAASSIPDQSDFTAPSAKVRT